MIIAEDTIYIAMSLKQGMFKGQPRQTSQGSSKGAPGDNEAALQRRKMKAYPFANQGKKVQLP